MRRTQETMREGGEEEESNKNSNEILSREEPGTLSSDESMTSGPSSPVP